MFTFLDSSALVAWYVFVHWQQTLGGGMSAKDRRWYTEGSKQVPGAPPGWLFGVAWFILYKLLVASAFIFFRESESSWTYLYVFVGFTINILLNKGWSVLFWDFNQTGWALFVAVMMLLTGIWNLVFMGLAQTHLWSIAFGLYVPYVLWLVYAIYLNWQWTRLRLPTKRRPINKL